MTSPTASTWYPRDYPVLVAAARRLDTAPNQALLPTALGSEAGMSTTEASLAATALIPDYLTGETVSIHEETATLDVVVTGLTSAGRRAAGLWPEREKHLSSFLAALQSAEEQTDDAQERTMLKRARDCFAGVPAAVLTAWLSGQIG